MEFTGRILKVCELRSGVSERSGNEWKTQGFVFEYFENPTDRYSDKVYLETFDENIIAQLRENLTVRIGFGHRVREYTNQQGKTMQINEMRVYKFEVMGAVAQQTANQPSQGANTQQAAQQPTAQQPIAGGGALGLSGQPSEAAPFPPQVDANGNTDDLPF